MSNKKKNTDSSKAPITAPTDVSQQQPTFIQSPEFKNIYTNFVQAQFSPFDVSLMIGETIGNDEQGRQLVQQKARLTMAASEAKVVMLILANTLRMFEEKFGEIKIPAEQMPPVRKEPTKPH